MFCFNDEVAMGVYQAAAERGLSVPGDVSVVGVDDLRIVAEALTPGLTTVALPHTEMGRWAVARLMDAIEGTPEPVGAKLPCALVERGSVARPR
ncbi:substrate-binding domain-containing protein [Actinokineospora soli]|uniref:Substrate-binding domain-containing protein n=1 Tax=Actinokineospora soli TaxID=1048753 RepID=A0ABW2TR40_9PSEU